MPYWFSRVLSVQSALCSRNPQPGQRQASSGMQLSLHHSATSLPFFFSRHCASAALSSSPIAAASWRAVLLHELRGQSGTYPQTAGGSVPALAARRAAVQGRATAVRTAEQELSWPSAFRCFEGRERRLTPIRPASRPRSH
ncbi:unnamed protein product [Prorocentrum cordatum]|uniref:Uncharacterized protein n=1 Tax=Prorocentrum cordatum TaxID=2364126 RepID=A0ABN9V4R1_9DINO|nr:unnamed protein product [Polarella glacialis]